MSKDSRSIDEALFGRIRRELLCIFLFNPLRSFYLLELVSLLRTGRGGVQRELRNLVSAGLVSRRRAGVKVLFSLSGECPVIEPLGELLRIVADHTAAVRNAVREHRRSIETAVLDGSVTEPHIEHVRLLLVADDVPEALMEELERVELLTGISLETSIYERVSAGSRLVSEPESQWVFSPSAICIVGSVEDLRQSEAEEDRGEEEPDLFSSMGFDW